MKAERFDLRYSFPKFHFLSLPSQPQTFEVYITARDAGIESIETNMNQYHWYSVGKCYTDILGNIYKDLEHTGPFELILGHTYGNTSKTLTLESLTEYILKIVNVTSSNNTPTFYVTLNTGLNMGMFDSPYRDKVLMPEQTYSISYNVEVCNSLPTKTDLSWLYWINDSKSYEQLFLNPDAVDENGNTGADNDYWVSLKPGNEEIIPIDSKTYTFSNGYELTIKGAQIQLVDGETIGFSLPYEHTKNNTYGYYWNSSRSLYVPTDDAGVTINPVDNTTGERGRDGVGAIRANDIATIGCSIGFAFYLDSEEISKTNEITLCHYELSAAEALKATTFKVSIKADRKIYITAKEGDSKNNLVNTLLFGDTVITENKWYYIVLGNTQRLYEPLEEDYTGDDPIKSLGINVIGENFYTPFDTLEGSYLNYTQDGLITETSFWPGASYLKTNPGICGPKYGFFFGDTGSAGLYISCIAGTAKNVIDNKVTSSKISHATVSKLLRPDRSTPYLEIVGYKDGVYTNPIIESTYLNSQLNSAKGEMSFYIYSDVYNAILQKSTEDYQYLVIRVLNNPIDRVILNSKMYIGYTSGKDLQPSIFSITDYLEESFTLNFQDIYNADPKNGSKNLIEALNSHFVTKHGTWGGYNGGCNGHLLYFNGDKNLVMEAHGDDYIPYGDDPSDKTSAQHPKGVGKETLNAQGTAQAADDQTGYGEDVFWDNFAWDKRTYKNYLRTGTSIVSNKYYSYGRVDVTMKIPKLQVGHYDFGICPALWLFHYIETYPEVLARWNKYPYKNLAIEGSDEIGQYKVLNDEIDIELPSHLINGKTTDFANLSKAFFATWDQANLTFDYDEAVSQGTMQTDYNKVLIDDQTHITVGNTLYRYKGRGNNPHIEDSWTAVEYGRRDTRCYPSFRNCKFNTWIGEYNSGDGWTATEAEYFDTSLRENYQSLLTRAADNWYGYADNHFHKWSIVWTPTKVVLLIDDVPYRVGRGYVPVNVMKYTAALWFPTMPRAIKTTSGTIKYKKTNDNTIGGIGLLDTDGNFDASNASELNGTRAVLNITDDTNIGTWAGRRAYWEDFHLDISEIKYTKYKEGEIVAFPTYIIYDLEGNPIEHNIEAETIHLSDVSTATAPPVQPKEGEPSLLYLGESYPESGLRILTGEYSEQQDYLTTVTFVTNPIDAIIYIKKDTDTDYWELTDHVYVGNIGDKLQYKIEKKDYATIEGEVEITRNKCIYNKLAVDNFTKPEVTRIVNKLATYDASKVTSWILLTDPHLFIPASKSEETTDTFDNTDVILNRAVTSLKQIVKNTNENENALNISLLALGGDFCGYSDEKQTANVTSDEIAANIDACYEVLKDIDIPFMGIPGNHDIYGGGDGDHKRKLVQQDYQPGMLKEHLCTNNPTKKNFKFPSKNGGKYTCNSYFDTDTLRIAFFDKFVPEIVCRYNFHSGQTGVSAIDDDNTTGPCYGGPDLTEAMNGDTYLTASTVQNVMTTIMAETTSFIQDLATDLGDRKIVIISHSCTKGYHVSRSWPATEDVEAGSWELDTRLTPLLYNKDTYPYPDNAKFYSGVGSYAAAFWLGNESFSQLTSTETNDAWNNGWSEYGTEDSWKDWMTYIKDTLVELGVPRSTILFNCFGHCHTDNQAQDSDNTLYISTQYAGTQKSGSNDTLIGTADHRHYNQYDNFEGPYHSTETITESAFDIFVYNHENNVLDVIRYGSGADRKYTYACIQEAYDEPQLDDDGNQILDENNQPVTIHHAAVYSWVMDRALVPAINITSVTDTDPSKLTIYIADLLGTTDTPDTTNLDSINITVFNQKHSTQYIGYKEWYICQVDSLTNATLYMTPTDDDTEGYHFTTDASATLKNIQIPLMLTKNKKYWYNIQKGDKDLSVGTFTFKGDGTDAITL